MYHLIDIVSKSLAVSPRELTNELHTKPVTAHADDYYDELFTLYNSYHAHLEDINLDTARKAVPDESNWDIFCNTYYNWVISDKEYCFRIADTKTSIKIGKVYVPAYTVTCMNTNRTFLIAPRIFPYLFVFAKKYERALDADDREIKLRIQSKEISTRVMQVTRSAEGYFTSCFGLSYDVFIRYLAESLYRIEYMHKYQHEGNMLDLTQTDYSHKTIAPHFRNGHLRTYKSGKQVFVRPTYVNRNK